ncbi:MAG: hypothetical protein WCJ59_02790 [bacterium]
MDYYTEKIGFALKAGKTDEAKALILEAIEEANDPKEAGRAIVSSVMAYIETVNDINKSYKEALERK